MADVWEGKLEDEYQRLRGAIDRFEKMPAEMREFMRFATEDGDLRGGLRPPRGTRKNHDLNPRVVHHYVDSTSPKPSLPTHLCFAAEMGALMDEGTMGDLGDEEHQEQLEAGPKLTLPDASCGRVGLAVHATLD
jgi:hypothetical protein